MVLKEQYTKTYTDMNFERKGLFELLNSMYPNASVLYPGCSFHITPSFYFQNVMYVDRSDKAIEFFSDLNDVSKLIDADKKYKQSSHIEFLATDYVENDDIVNYKYDILISLYADDVVINCLHYMRENGIIVSNNYHDEVIHLIKEHPLDLIGVIKSKQGRYIFSKEIKNRPSHRDEEKMQKACMKNTSEGVRYVDNETYYVLRISGSV